MIRLFQLFILVTCISLLSTAHGNHRRHDPSWVREQIIEKKQCHGCILQNANLSGANLSGANLTGAEFFDSNLMNATWINGKKCTDRKCSNLR